jgi:hypothetical protein
MDDATNSAVNRWAAEKSMGGSFAENIIDVLYIVLALVVMQIQQLNY